MSWRPRPDYPWLADTSANRHLFMPFDTDVPDISALTTSDAPVDMVWEFTAGRTRTARHRTPGINKTRQPTRKTRSPNRARRRSP
jgi:hypothetical protein